MILRLSFFLIYAVFCAPHLAVAQQDLPGTPDEYEKQYRERITKDKLNGVYIPKNLEDALVQLDKITDAEGKAKMIHMPEDSVCQYMHARLGQWIILNWGFYGGSRLSHYLKSAGVTFPDDQADFIILAYHKRLNKKPFSIKDVSATYRDKRRKEHQDDVKQGEVIHQETRKKNRR